MFEAAPEKITETKLKYDEELAVYKEEMREEKFIMDALRKLPE